MAVELVPEVVEVEPEAVVPDEVEPEAVVPLELWSMVPMDDPLLVVEDVLPVFVPLLIPVSFVPLVP